MPVSDDFLAKMDAELAVDIAARASKAEPKLTFEQRCEVLALYMSGFTRDVLADAYGINRRTVGHIRSLHSPHYRNVRAKHDELGTADFRRTYISEEAYAKAVASRLKAEKGQPLSGAAQDKADSENQHIPKKRMNQKEGEHTLAGKHTATGNDYVFEVIWVDGLQGEGWYWRGIDEAESFGDFSGEVGRPFPTSTAAYNAAMKEGELE